jgi:ADP-ribose pyrophosphatase
MHHHLDWQELRRSTLYKTAFAELQERDYRLPDESVLEKYAVAVEADGVSVVAQTEAGELILIRQFRPAPAKVALDVVGGAIEPTEDPLVAAKRELLEESGYVSDDWIALGGVQPAQHRLASTVYSFLAKNCRKVKEMDGDATEFLEMVPVSPAEFERLVRAGEFSCAICIAAYFLAMPHLSR